MRQNPDKPFRTFDEQLDLLKSRNLTISDDDFAKYALSTFSYYDLINGYKEHLMPNDVFIPGVTIEYLYSLFLLDKSIQSIIVKYGLIIENYFKNQFSYQLSKKYGVHHNNYLNSKNYNENASGITFQRHIIGEISFLFNDSTSKNPTKYYLINHNHIPAWILFKNISLGVAINFFKLLKTDDKVVIANALIPSTTLNIKQKVELLIRSLDGLKEFRNCAAHNLNFVNCTFPNSLPLKSLYKLIPGSLYMKENQIIQVDKKACRHLYGAMLSILLLLNTPHLKSMFINDLHFTISNHQLIGDDSMLQGLVSDYCQLTRLPNNFMSRLSKTLTEFNT